MATKRFASILHPLAGRRLPRELRAARVGRIGRSLARGLEDPGFEELLKRIDGGALIHRGNRIELFFDGDEAIAAMLAAADGAEREIFVEAYIFEDDATGQRVGSSLLAAARRGVDVRVVADAWGSVTTRESFWTGLREGGVRVRIFNPLFSHTWWHAFRDHRKLMVVDRRVAFTGGMNIANDYGSWPASGLQRSSPMRDTHVRIEGPAAWEMAAVFSESWEMTGGEPIAPSEMRGGGEADGAGVLVLESRRGRGQLEMAAAFAAIVAAARESVWVTNAYFAPGRIAIHVFSDAARRGLDVRFLLPGRTDVPVVRHAGHASFSRLLRRGVRIYEYEPAIIHAKTLVADRSVAIIGSTNLDFRSFRLNAECNAVIFDHSVGKTMCERFEEDLGHAREVDLESWRARGFLHRFGDRAAAVLRPLL